MKQFINNIRNLKIHEILFYVFLFLLPIQTRILYKPDTAYISWYFDYHLAFFIYLTDIILVTCFISCLIFDFHGSRIKDHRLNWLILAFLLIVSASLFHVQRLDLGLYQTFKWLELWFLVVYIRSTFRETKQFEITIGALFASAIGESLIGLWQFHVQHSLNLGFLGEYIAPMGTSGLSTINTVSGKLIRAYGTMPHPNVLGAFLVLGLVCGFYLLSRETYAFNPLREGRELKQRISLAADEAIFSKGRHATADAETSVIKQSLAMGIGLIIILVGLFLTFSRLAWAAGAIAMFSFLLFHVKHKDWHKSLAILIIGLVSCSTIFFGYHQYLKSRTLDTNPTSVSDRAFFNNLGIELTSHHPILGVGAGNYVPALQGQYQLEPWRNQPAHNIFIFLSAELGLLAVLVFIMILFEIFSRLNQVPWNILKFSLLTLGLLLLAMSQFDHYFVTIQQGRLALFVVLGLISALPNLQRE